MACYVTMVAGHVYPLSDSLKAGNPACRLVSPAVLWVHEAYA